MVDEERGEGRTGLEGLVSEAKDLNVDSVSGTGVALALLAKVGPPDLGRRIIDGSKISLKWRGIAFPAVEWVYQGSTAPLIV